MKIRYLHLLLFLLTCVFTFAQSPYQLERKKDLTIGGLALGTGAAAYYFHKQIDPLSEMEILSFEQEELSSFRDWPTNQNSGSANKASDILAYSAVASPVALTLLDKKMRKDALTISVISAETFLLNLGFTALVKNTVRRTRPYVYNPDIPLDQKISRSAQTSFYSGHTSETASMSFLTASLYAHYHPDSKWKPVVWTAAAVMPAATGYFRMKAGRHFFSDVLTGYIMGAAVGYIVPKLHLRKKDKEQVTLHF